ncbi:MAG: SGNH/GDSL hydrolase family protein [Cytophagales bacterium]
MKDHKFTYLALGDSYTIGEAVTKSYPQLLVESWKQHFGIETDVKILAKTGWRSDQLLLAFYEEIERVYPSKHFDLISILIGVNNLYQGLDLSDFAEEFETLVKKAIEITDQSSVVAISIPDYGFTPFGADKKSEIYSKIDLFNERIRKSCEWMGIPFYYITDLTRKNDPLLVASDQLHISEKCHRLIAERLASGFYFKITEKSTLK